MSRVGSSIGAESGASSCDGTLKLVAPAEGFAMRMIAERSRCASAFRLATSGGRTLTLG